MPDSWTYDLTPEAAERLGGRRQLSQLGQGGYNEMTDPSAVEWDDEFGFLTKPENISAHDTFSSGADWLPLVAVGGLGAAMAAPAIAAGGGLFGGVEGAAGAAFDAVPGAMSPLTEGAMGAMSPELGSLGGAAFDAVPGAMAPLTEGSMSSMLPQLGDMGTNWFNTARGLWDSTKPLRNLNSARQAFQGGKMPQQLSGPGYNGPGATDGTDGGGFGNLDWQTIIGSLGGLALGRKQPDFAALGERDRQSNIDQTNLQTMANRPNQSTPWGSSSWTKDPVTGQWTQKQELNPQDQARLEQFRQIAGNRMQNAQGVRLGSGNVDYSKIPSLGGLHLGG
jgi:hypothetical protein